MEPVAIIAISRMANVTTTIPAATSHGVRRGADVPFGGAIDAGRGSRGSAGPRGTVIAWVGATLRVLWGGIAPGSVSVGSGAFPWRE